MKLQACIGKLGDRMSPAEREALLAKVRRRTEGGAIAVIGPCLAAAKLAELIDHPRK